MIYTELTKKAMQIAYNAHHGTYDKGGTPYFLHPLYLAEQMTTEEETAAALLHDVIEDTEVTAADLMNEGLPLSVINLVLLLTKQPSEDYFSYISRISENSAATRVKLADLRHNSDLSRLKQITEEDLERVEKYKKAIKILSNE